MAYPGSCSPSYSRWHTTNTWMSRDNHHSIPHNPGFFGWVSFPSFFWVTGRGFQYREQQDEPTNSKTGPVLDHDTYQYRICWCSHHIREYQTRQRANETSFSSRGYYSRNLKLLSGRTVVVWIACNEVAHCWIRALGRDQGYTPSCRVEEDWQWNRRLHHVISKYPLLCPFVVVIRKNLIKHWIRRN